MISSRSSKLFLLGLAFTINSLSTHASSVRPIRSVRGRLLQDNTDGDDIPSIDQQPDIIPSQDEQQAPDQLPSTDKPSKDLTPSIDDPPSADDRLSPRAGVVAPKARQCNTQQGPDIVKFECKAVTENAESQIEDQLKFQVIATKGDYLKIKVEYETELETAETETETETQYTLVYNRLIEYRKVGEANDDHYEWGVDEIVAELPLNNWEELTAVETIGDLITFSATMGMATFTFTIAQTDSEDITTNKMKIDFLLENYPWNESGDTYVALVSHIDTKRNTKTETEGHDTDNVSDVLIDFEDAVTTIGFVPFGEYTWAKTAEATFNSINLDDTNATDVMVERSGNSSRSETATIAVIASQSPDTESTTEGPSGDTTVHQEIAFSFVGAGRGADRIFWDPEAGVGYASSAARLWGSFFVSAVSIALFFL